MSFPAQVIPYPVHSLPSSFLTQVINSLPSSFPAQFIPCPVSDPPDPVSIHPSALWHSSQAQPGRALPARAVSRTNTGTGAEAP